MNKKWSISHRIWHWLSAFIILCLLGTVVLRNTFLNAKDNAKIVQEKLASYQLDKDEVISATKEIRKQMWEWHNYFGFVLAFLTVWKAVQLLRKKDLSSVSKILSIRNASFKQKNTKPIVSALYVSFYALTVLMVTTGLIMYFYKELGLSKDVKNVLKEVHEISMWFFVGFIPIHIIGVIWAENTTEKGIISDMVNGGERP